MGKNETIILVVLLVGGLLSLVTRKLTIPGAITGIVAGYLVFSGAGYTGITMLASFFILGSLATSWKMNIKTATGLAEKNEGRRTAGQVIANGGVAAVAGLLAWRYPIYKDIFRLMIAGSLSAAAADTLSSELGNYYGRRFYNIVTGKPDIKGENGVVSLEGSLAGLAGSCCIALIYAVGYGWNVQWLWIVIAGTIGSFADSVLGATLERKQRLGNNTVNFLNTLTGALAAMVLALL